MGGSKVVRTVPCAFLHSLLNNFGSRPSAKTKPSWPHGITAVLSVSRLGGCLAARPAIRVWSSGRLALVRAAQLERLKHDAAVLEK
jgi:hypothetical protein